MAHVDDAQSDTRLTLTCTNERCYHAFHTRSSAVLSHTTWHNAHSSSVLVSELSVMLQVGIVYSRDNIWANIQLSGHPWDISWNLGDSSCWRPFFGAVLQPREMASIQVTV